jgi:hypothetical protein
MARRLTVNKTGFANKEGVNHKEAWVCFPCLNCGAMVKANIGISLPTLEDAMENCVWPCPECGYEHSILSDIPDSMENFPEEWRSSDNPHCQGFWTAFFRMQTKDVFSYWKHCSKCGRLLPVSCFDQHNDKPGSSAWKPLNRQAECKACKAAINTNLNKERTHEQLFEGTINRRIGDLLSATDDKANPKEVFELFGGKCFKTGVPLNYNDRSSWHIDHIMPSKYFWPLTKSNAALLSNEANESKGGKWPSEFYTDKELVALSKLTGAPLELISSKEPIYNKNVDPNKAVSKLFDNVREASHLPKLVQGLKNVLIQHKLVEALTPKNKMLLGLTNYQRMNDDNIALLGHEKEQFAVHSAKSFDLSSPEFWNVAAEPFECYKWDRFEQRIMDFFGGDKTILVGCAKDKNHKEWIFSHNLYNVRLGKTRGTMESKRELFGRTELLVLYELEQTNMLNVFRIISHKEMSKEELLSLDYPNKKARELYMTFNIIPLDMDISLLSDMHLIEKLLEINSNIAKGTPVFIEP